MAFEATVAKWEADLASAEEELQYLPAQQANQQNIADATAARIVELQQLVAEGPSVLALLRGAFD